MYIRYLIIYIVIYFNIFKKKYIYFYIYVYINIFKYIECLCIYMCACVRFCVYTCTCHEFTIESKYQKTILQQKAATFSQWTHYRFRFVKCQVHYMASFNRLGSLFLQAFIFGSNRQLLGGSPLPCIVTRIGTYTNRFCLDSLIRIASFGDPLLPARTTAHWFRGSTEITEHDGGVASNQSKLGLWPVV